MDSLTEDSIALKIVARLNNELKYDKDLTAVKNLKTKLLEDYDHKKNSLDLENENTSCKAKTVLRNLNKKIHECDKVSSEFVNFSKDIQNYLDTIDNMINKLEMYVVQIQSLEITAEYIKIAQKVENISNELHQSVVDNDTELSVTLYANLCEVMFNIQGSQATHLLAYVSDVIHHWHNYLKDKISVIFDEILKTIKWPFVNTNLTSPLPSRDEIQKLQLYVEYLLQIQLPEESSKLLVTSTLATDIPSVCLPITFLVKPLRRRFLFHFYGNKQTNRPDKPEWYMTQILTWIRDHQQFVQNTIQPVINRLAMHHINAKVEFIRALIQLCVEKLEKELPTLAYDDSLFSHCVDEALGMERELRSVYNYPISQPGCLGPLTHAPILQKWLNMEKKYALEKMDAIFTSPTAWNNLILETDDLKITECANSFISLLTTMTERYQLLPQPGHRLQFLSLQLDLLDDFRIRLLQIWHDTVDENILVKLSFILNTVNYIIEVLTEWSETIHFINLHYFKYQFTHVVSSLNNANMKKDDLYDENGSVFDEILSLYGHMKDDLIMTLTEAVVLDVKARSRAYRHDRWNDMPAVKDTLSFSLTTSACPMFQILTTRLHELEELIASTVFTDVWRKIAKQLNEFFYDELILQNTFSEGGANQINYDLTKNLFPLFGQYTSKPDMYFKSIKEACILLTLNTSPAILLLDALESDQETNKEAVLQEIGIKKLSVRETIKILKRRNDIQKYIQFKE